MGHVAQGVPRAARAWDVGFCEKMPGQFDIWPAGYLA